MPIPEFLAELRERIGHRLLLLPGVTGFVTNDDGAVLLVKRSDNGLWELPAGIIEPGEMPAQTLVREMYEETGLVVQPEAVVGVYGAIRVQYSNGDEAEYVTTVFRCSVLGGEVLNRDGEASEVAFLPPDSSEVTEAMRLFSFDISDFAAAQHPFDWDPAWLESLV